MSTVRRTTHFLPDRSDKHDEQHSIFVAGHLAVTQWGNMFSDEVTAAAMRDRLLPHSQLVNIKGTSYRLKGKRKAGTLSPAVAPPAA